MSVVFEFSCKFVACFKFQLNIMHARTCSHSVHMLTVVPIELFLEYRFNTFPILMNVLPEN